MAEILGFPHGFNGNGNTSAPEIAPPINEPEPAPPNNPIACQALENAYRLIEGDRHIQHGKAERCHDAIAELWTWWTGIKVDRHDVAMMLDLMKTARIKTGAYNGDCYDDKLGYASLAKQFREQQER